MKLHCKSYTLLSLLYCWKNAFSFVQIPSRSIHGSIGFTQRSSGAEGGDLSRDDDTPVGPEKSRMNDFIADYLGKNNPPEEEERCTADILSQDISMSTHLVAIPMDTCHELLLELESVQRAILYHCPILLDACIPPAMTRLPLLYVRAPRASSSRVIRVLASAVEQLAEKHLFRREDLEQEGEEVGIDQLNAEGYHPFTMTFQSLEIDGANNNVLNTVARMSAKSTKKLQTLVYELRKRVEKEGWQTALPPDPHVDQGSSTTDDMKSSTSMTFRPRIPFMELPKEFDKNLNRFKDESTEITEEDAEFLTSDQGGNGISPIFWCQWWDDVFGRNIRLREIGVYPRAEELSTAPSPPSDLSYSMFYLPYETIPLPDGSPEMLKVEQKFQKYQDDRLEEQKDELGGEIDGKGTTDTAPQNAEPDILMSKTRERLENLYINSAGETVDLYGEEDTIGAANNASNSLGITDMDGSGDDDDDEEDEPILDLPPPTGASPDDFMEDWMKARIRKAIESQESVKSRNPVKKEKPPIKDNPVFKAYKEGTLVPKSPKPKPLKKDLGPYPSRAHFAGIWRVVNSPTGFPTEEDSNETSENLILRIDGTTAGGPVLDPETRQKAAGGTWKIIENNDGDVKLRVRLLIPPKKERVIEMIGFVDRIAVGKDIPLASKNFGVPQLEALARDQSDDMEELLQCDGDVFIEDAITKKNRDQIGKFSLMKLQSPKERGEYTVTIPKPIRNQD